MTTKSPAIAELEKELMQHSHPLVHEIISNARRLAYQLRNTGHPLYTTVQTWIGQQRKIHYQQYGQHLYSEGTDAATRVPVVAARFSANSPARNGYEVLNAFFDHALANYPALYAFGEDVGQIGGVNQSFANMQKKYGEERVFDTGIREWTIMGQAIGMAMRGLRPIAKSIFRLPFIWSYSAIRRFIHFALAQ
ncbi:MAG: hypothetical protein R2795_20410 [Saprospiraceae bacterium]